jgi:hypothetical protein
MNVASLAAFSPCSHPIGVGLGAVLSSFDDLPRPDVWWPYLGLWLPVMPFRAATVRTILVRLRAIPMVTA